MPYFEKENKFGTGRPPGARNRTTLWLEQLGQERIGKVVNTVGDKAEKGDMRAASLIFARVWPCRRGSLMEIDLPPVNSVDGIIQAQGELVACLARGEITAEEAASVSALLENQRRAIETGDLARRIEELERRKSQEPAAAGSDPLGDFIAGRDRADGNDGDAG